MAQVILRLILAVKGMAFPSLEGGQPALHLKMAVARGIRELNSST